MLERDREEAHALLVGERYPETLLGQSPSPWATNPIYTEGHLWGGLACETLSAGDCQTSTVCELQMGDCIPTGCDPLSPQDCIAARGCVLRENEDCVGQPLVFATAMVDTRDLGGTRQVIRDFDLVTSVVSEPNDFDIAVGQASALVPAAAHATGVARVDWADANPTVPQGVVSISMPIGAANWTGFDHLSLRAGQLAVLSGSALERQTPVSFEIVVVDAQGREHSLDPGALVAREVIAGLPCTNCYYQGMHTIRFPTPDICVPPFEADAIQRIELRFEDDQDISRVIVDTIELTASPFDHDPDVACGTMSGAFLCETTTAFEAFEDACEGEPTPTCPSHLRVSTAVDPPTVDLATHGAPGWVVHLGAGWDVDNLTPSQEEVVWAKCVEACELEWAGEPISANCDGVGVFEAPVLLGSPSVGSWAVIPEANADGSGVFIGSSLGCDLQAPDGCCTLFGENLCAAAPKRATVAAYPLERAEQYRLALGGAGTKVTLESPGANVSRTMTGVAGYGTAGPSPRPLVLGSLELATTSPITLTDTCPDMTAFSKNVSISLAVVQPAFGISVGSLAAGFPPGALRMQATIVDEDTTEVMNVGGVNVLPVVGSVRGSDTFAFEDLEVELAIPCGSSLLPVTARFDIARTAALGRPPTGSITIPNQVPCNGPPTDLTATISDPEGDIESVRWFLGDVLLEESIARISFTQAHTVTLRVRDERGATLVRSKAVTCL